ncbi:MAG TPA: hypothetical protein VFW62_04970 [bacterium]|nr:hypothetical protein [bacterium]
MSPQIPSHPIYRSGERWKYKAPPGQEDSRLVVLGAEKDPGIGWIIHISVESLRLPAPRHPDGVVTEIMHFPISLVSFEQALIAEDKARFAPVVFPNEGYETWKENQGGVWSVPVASLVQMIAGFYSDED